MTHLELVPVPPVAQLAGVSQHYGKTVALNNITLDIPARCMVGLIGPDGVGKSSLLSLISGARVIEQGNVMVLGGDMRDPKHRRDVCPRIAWMPQGLGKNLYHTLSVYENVDFFARLFGHDKAEREVRINELLCWRRWILACCRNSDWKPSRKSKRHKAPLLPRRLCWSNDKAKLVPHSRWLINARQNWTP